MNNLKAGDIIEKTDGTSPKKVIARLETLIWYKDSYPHGLSPNISMMEIDDLINFGYQIRK